MPPPPRQWLVTLLVIINSLLLPLLLVSNLVHEAEAAPSHHRHGHRGAKKHKTHHGHGHTKSKTASYHRHKRARRPRHTHTHGAQFGTFLTVVKVVFFFSILPFVVYMVWQLATDPDTARVAKYLFVEGQKRVYRALGWPLPQQQAAVSVEPRQQGMEEEGTYFGDPLSAYDDDENRKDR